MAFEHMASGLLGKASPKPGKCHVTVEASAQTKNRTSISVTPGFKVMLKVQRGALAYKIE